MKRSTMVLATLAAILALLVFAGCDRDDTATLTGAAAVGADPGELLLPSGNDITPVELRAILHMREEEKLAHDVYDTMYNQWQSRIFNNIRTSEQMHIEAMLRVMNRYGIPDSAGMLDPGKFNDPALQALYDELVLQGSVTAGTAMAVGVRIEELDIADLQAAIAVTDNKDILQVYTNLLEASQRHLAAFRQQPSLPPAQ